MKPLAALSAFLLLLFALPVPRLAADEAAEARLENAIRNVVAEIGRVDEELARCSAARAELAFERNTTKSLETQRAQITNDLRAYEKRMEDTRDDGESDVWAWLTVFRASSRAHLWDQEMKQGAHEYNLVRRHMELYSIGNKLRTQGLPVKAGEVRRRMRFDSLQALDDAILKRNETFSEAEDRRLAQAIEDLQTRREALLQHQRDLEEALRRLRLEPVPWRPAEEPAPEPAPEPIPEPTPPSLVEPSRPQPSAPESIGPPRPADGRATLEVVEPRDGERVRPSGAGTGLGLKVTYPPALEGLHHFVVQIRGLGPLHFWAVLPARDRGGLLGATDLSVRVTLPLPLRPFRGRVRMVDSPSTQPVDFEIRSRSVEASGPLERVASARRNVAYAQGKIAKARNQGEMRSARRSMGSHLGFLAKYLNEAGSYEEALTTAQRGLEQARGGDPDSGGWRELYREEATAAFFCHEPQTVLRATQDYVNWIGRVGPINRTDPQTIRSNQGIELVKLAERLLVLGVPFEQAVQHYHRARQINPAIEPYVLARAGNLQRILGAR